MIQSIERQIRKVEGFEVRILHGRDLRDVRSDKRGIPGYRYVRMMKHDATVLQWRKQRFGQSYPGYRVEVLRADGRVAHGAMLLGTVRDGYLSN